MQNNMDETPSVLSLPDGQNQLALPKIWHDSVHLVLEAGSITAARIPYYFRSLESHYDAITALDYYHLSSVGLTQGDQSFEAPALDVANQLNEFPLSDGARERLRVLFELQGNLQQCLINTPGEEPYTVYVPLVQLIPTWTNLRISSIRLEIEMVLYWHFQNRKEVAAGKRICRDVLIHTGITNDRHLMHDGIPFATGSNGNIDMNPSSVSATIFSQSAAVPDVSQHSASNLHGGNNYGQSTYPLTTQTDVFPNLQASGWPPSIPGLALTDEAGNHVFNVLPDTGAWEVRDYSRTTSEQGSANNSVFGGSPFGSGRNSPAPSSHGSVRAIDMAGLQLSRPASQASTR